MCYYFLLVHYTTTSRMNAPAVLLVPPSPLEYDSQTPSPLSTGTTSSNDSQTTSSSQPETMFTAVDEQRQSSETTIFSIYSMYGEEHASRASWAVTGDRRATKELPTLPPASLGRAPDHGDSLMNGDRSSSPELGLAYYDPPPSSKPQPVIDLTDGSSGPSASAASSGRASLRTPPRPNSRPASAYTPPTTLQPPPSELLEAPSTLAPVPVVAPAGVRPGDFRALSSHSSFKSFRSRSISPQSHRSSRASPPSHTRQSTASQHRDLPPIPHDARTTPPTTPPPNSVRQAASPLLLSPQNSVRLPAGRVLSNASSPSSKISLVPSEGEDMDSFHVRNTYAVLEVSGVKGDGYEEGVERTRARLGSNRQSQSPAEISAGGKPKDLDPREIEVLASVDRCVSSPARLTLALM